MILLYQFSDNSFHALHTKAALKGFMQAKDKTKLRRMAKYYPHINLILIDKSFYNDLIKKMKDIIKFY